MCVCACDIKPAVPVRACGCRPAGDGVLTWSDLYVYIDRKHGKKFYARGLVKTVSCCESFWT
jgi:hypothetical protein